MKDAPSLDKSISNLLNQRIREGLTHVDGEQRVPALKSKRKPRPFVLGGKPTHRCVIAINSPDILGRAVDHKNERHQLRCEPLQTKRLAVQHGDRALAK